MATDRTTASVLLSVVLLAGVAAMRPNLDPSGRRSGIPPELFWQQKAAMRERPRLVVAGDSRVYRGIATEEMQAVLRVRVANFGFSGVGFEERYLARLEELLPAAGAPRAILLSLTPSSLAPKSCRDNGYLDELRKASGFGGALAGLWAPLADRFEPYTLRQVAELARLASPMLLYEEDYLPTGWVASDQRPRDPARALGAYRAFFEESRADPARFEALLERIGAWSRRGIGVYALRMPISRSLRRLEDERGGLEWSTGIERLRAAGAVWLGDYSADARFSTYDGSHLTAASARAFSRELASTIQAMKPR